MRDILKKSIAAAALICSCLCGVSHAATSRTAQDRRAAEEKREFASFIDGFMAGMQKEQRIPGMVVAVVRNGETLYLKGYGDGAGGGPADPERTVYRVGRISEIMTAAAALQLAVRGRISLDEDVNGYLRRWALPGKPQEPVTIRHLLTHTGGFDGKEYEICAPTSADERAFASRLPKLMPARYDAPGRAYSSSGMGYALAGSVVERYSRQSFASAIHRYIFEPLGMNNSSFAPSDALMSSLAEGHAADGSSVPYAWRADLPAMGMVSTASDMARFMLAQLDEGALGRNRILPATYANSMLRRHFSPHPRIEGTGLAYFEKNVLGVRTLQQFGHIPGYSSFLMLAPDRKFGLFFAANADGLKIHDDLSKAVARRFWVVSGDRAGGSDSSGAQALAIPNDLEGWYRHNTISRHTAEKARFLLGPQARVERSGEHLLLTDGKGAARTTERWAPTDEPGLFRQIDENDALGDSYLFFGRGASGAVETMTVRSVLMTYDRLSKADAYPYQVAQIGVFILTAVISALGLFLGHTINRSRLPWEKGLRSATELWTLSVLFCFIQIAFAAALLIAASAVGHRFATFVPYQVKALFIIPIFAAILLGWSWFRFLANLFNHDHHKAEKLLLFLVMSSETAYMLFLAHWRLLGFMF